MLENWTISQINLMENALGEIMELETQSIETTSGRRPRDPKPKRVSDSAFLAMVGIKPGLPPKVK